MNLIHHSSNWLIQSDPTKSIQVRTKDVLSKFRNYISRQPDDFFESFSSTKEEAITLINTAKEMIDVLINVYLRGNLCEAISIAGELLGQLKPSYCEAGPNFYRARSNDSGYLFKTEEMFHIPYEYRHKITNQRYSISGLPCLYIASSTYLAWEELERPNYQTCNFCLLANTSRLYYFDLCIPASISSLNDILKTCLALASSLKSQKGHVFKLEYIMPQCLLQAITANHDYANDGIGIRYYSVPFLNKDTNTFKIDFENETCTSRFINIVIPATSPKKSGLSPLLKKLFDQSPTISIMDLDLKNINIDTNAVTYNNDDYYRSQFYVLESHLYTMLKEKIYSKRYSYNR